ncbi:MAG: GNAT family N-acetyltransferase [Clostridia bacterium]|nr:GNAT family N-acetyltransferase [Clostridia bacterium]
MESKIRYMEEKDRPQVLEMMRVFYASEAVFTNGSEEIFNTDIDNCTNDNPYIEGYVFENDNRIQGYAMLAKSFSTEFGKPCIWIEDIYIQEEYRGLGIGSLFLNLIEDKYPNSLFRLEVEVENKRAINVYKKCGYDVLPYMEMKKAVK